MVINMIWFNQGLVNEAVKELHDMIDIAKDINRIDSIVYGIWTPSILIEAYNLDIELRQKYKTINIMLDVAHSLPKIRNCAGLALSYDIPSEIKALRQDRFGIFTDILLKKGIIKEIKEFIETVD